MPKTTFVRNPLCLTDVRNGADYIRQHFGPDHHDYYVAAERVISATEWEDLTTCFLADRVWIEEFSNREYPDIDGAPGCLRVTSPHSEIALLIDTQGYPYARYVAIESPA